MIEETILALIIIVGSLGIAVWWVKKK